MNKMNKYLFTLLSLVLFSFWIQGNNSHLPPSVEDTYLFTILKYDRQPQPPAYIFKGIEEMVNKPILQWNAKDSLFFAYENVHLKEFEKAYNNFVRLNTDSIQEKHAETLYKLTLFKLKKYTTLQNLNQYHQEKTNEEKYTYQDAFNAIYHAYEQQLNGTFDLQNDPIFPILKDENLQHYDRKEVPHKNKFVAIAFAIDSCFRQLTLLHDENDKLLSKAFEEMGDFQRKYLYVTNAYFYYSAALKYDKNNKSVIQKLSQTNEEINQRNFIKISFKNKFGKVIKNRYKFSKNYIEKVEKPAVTQENYIPPQQVYKKDYIPWMDSTLITILALTMLLLAVLLFLKTE